ncbi:hypothetical protein pb186bvf_007074 [Paramecium bursaria]
MSEILFCIKITSSIIYVYIRNVNYKDYIANSVTVKDPTHIIINLKLNKSLISRQIQAQISKL